MFVLVSGAVLTLGSAAQAQTITWDGDTDNQWTTATNWSGDNVPDTVAETAQIAAESTPNQPVITTAITVGATNFVDGNLDIRAGGTLNTATMTISQRALLGVRTGGTLNAGSVTLLGNINVNDGGALNGNVNLSNNGALFVLSGGTVTGDVNNTSTRPGSSFVLRPRATLVGNLTTSGNAVNERTTAGQGIQGNVTINSGRFVNSGVINGSTAVFGGTLEIQAGSDLSNAGRLTINGGTVNVNANETVGSLSGAGGITIDDGQTLTTGSDNSSTTFSGVISGGGALTKNGSGTFALSAANTYTGITNVDGGVLDVTGLIASSIIRLRTAGELRVYGNSVSDTARIGFEGPSTLTLEGDETIGVLASSPAPGTPPSVSLGTNRLTLSSGSDVFTGTITGTGGITVAGAFQSLTSPATFTGDIHVTGGGLAVAGIASANASVSGGNLEGRLSTGTTLTVSGTGTFFSRRTQTIAALTQTGGTLTDNETLTVSGDHIMSGGTIAAGTTVNGNGTKTLSGGTIAGTLGGTGIARITSDTVTIAGTGTITSDVEVAAGGRLRISHSDAIGGTITTTGSVVSYANGVDEASPLVIGSNTTQLEVLGTDAATQSGIVSSLPGFGGFEKIGTGSLTLSGANTYEGVTNVSAGTLVVSNGAGLGASGAGNRTIVADGATLALVGVAPGGITTDEALTLNGAGVAGGGALRNLSGNNIVTGAITLAGATRINSDANRMVLEGDITGTQNLTLGGAGQVFIGGNIATGSATLTKDGTGVGELGGDNTFTGAVNVNAGLLRLLGGSALEDSVQVQVASGATLEVRGNETIGNLSGAGTVAVERTLTLGDATDSTFSGVISDVFFPGGLVKQGTGTLTLSGVNTYTGFTTVNAGTLNLTGRIARGVIVNEGGALTLNAGSRINSGTLLLNGGLLTVTGDTEVRPRIENAGTIRGVADAELTGFAVELSGRNFTPGTITAATGTTLTITGALDSGNGQITIGSASETGTVILNSGDSPLTSSASTLVVAGGTLGFNGSTVPRVFGLTRSVTISSGAVFDMSGLPVRLNDLSGSGTITSSSAGLSMLLLASSSDTDFSGIIEDGASTVSLIKDGTGTLTLSGANTYSGTTTVTAGTLRIGDGGTTGSLGSGDVVNNAALMFDRSDDVTVTNAVSGSGTLTQQGAGTLTLTVANTYTGATTVAAGTLAITHGSALGTTDAGTTVADGATLALSGGITTGEALTLNGTGLGGGGALRNLSRLNIVAGAITLGSATRINSDAGRVILQGDIGGTQNLTLGGAGEINVNGNIGTGSGTLTKDGTGILVLRGNNTFTGAVTVTAGTLALELGSALEDSVQVQVASGAQLQVRGNETIGTLSGAGSVTLNGVTLTLGDATDSIFSGVITEFAPGNLVKQGTGTLTLSGTNAYAGTTRVNGGTLRVTGAIQSGSVTVNAGGTLSVDGAAIRDTATVELNGTGNLTVDGGDETIGSLAGGATSSVTLTNSLTTGGNNASTTFAGVMSGAGGLTKAGTGTLILSGANTYSGATLVSAGALNLTGSVTSSVVTVENATLRVDGASLGDTATVTLNGTGDLTVDGADETIGSLAGGATSTVTLTNSLTTGGNNASTTFDGVISGAGGLTKAGTGTLTLSGSNTYTGATTISAGTLAVTGSIAGDVTVDDGTLRIGNSGAIGGTITTTGSVISYADGVIEASPVILSSATTQLEVLGTDAAEQSGVISGTDPAFGFEKIGTGTLTLSGANTYTGATTISAGTLILTGGAALADTAGVNIAAGTTLRIDQSETTGALTNLGTVDLSSGNGTADTVLTVNGGYSSGSVLRVDTMLGDDSATSDRVVIAGDTSGTTQVFVNVLGGTGAQTRSGIRIVDVAGASGGTFVLANGDTVLPGGQAALTAPGGEFLYALRRNGGDWVLQSQLQPAAAAFEVYPSALLALTQAGSLSQRLGARQMLTRGAAEPDGARLSTRGQAATPHTGVWLSISAARLDVTPRASTGGLSHDQSIRKIEAGVDMVLAEATGGTLVGGISLVSGRGDVASASVIGAGRIDTDAQGIDLSATWHGFDGFYADLQLGYRDFDSDLSSATAGVLATGVGGTGRFVSMEIGRTFEVESGLTLTPQAQLSWAEVRMDSVVAPGALTVAPRDAESLRLRMGLAAERNWQTAGGAAARLTGIGNLIHEDSDTTVLFGTTPLGSSAPDWSAEIGLGGSLTWTDGNRRTALFGELTAARGLGGGDLSGISGTFGLRLTW